MSVQVTQADIQAELQRRQQPLTATHGDIQAELDNRMADMPDISLPPKLASFARQPSLTDKVRGIASDAMLSVRNAIKGDTRREFDLPEFPQGSVRVGDQIIAMQDKLAWARGNPLAQAEILNEQMIAPMRAAGMQPPEMQFDSFGNLIIQYASGQAYYANKPGASMGDISGAVPMLAEVASARWGGAAGNKVGGLTGRALGSGTALAGVSVGEDLVAQGLGSEQPVDWTRAQLMGLLGIGGEIAGELGVGFLEKVLANSRFVAGNKLTKEGADVLRQAEIDPQAVTPEFLRRWNFAARNATDPRMAARAIEADSLPSPVPLSRGDVTRNPAHQAFEDAALKGTRGETAQRTMAGFREGQQEALKANLPAIQQRLGRPGVAQPGEGMAMVQQRLGAMRDRMKADVDAAYTTARGSGTSIASEGVKRAGAHFREQLKTWNPRTAPKTHGLLRDFEKVTKGKAGYQVSGVKVDALENWLQQVNKLARSTDPVEAGAAKALAKSYNDYFDEMLDAALVRGEPEAIQAYMKARTLRRQFHGQFEHDKLLAKIIELDEGVMKLTPTEALNTVFTANTLGGKMGSVRTLERIRKRLGSTSDEWMAIREEGFLRLLSSQGQGNARGADLERLFSGDKFATALDTAVTRNKELMETLYSKAEIALLQQFKRVGLRATNRVGGAVNSSNSGHEMLRIANDLFGGSSKVGQFLWQKLGLGDSVNAVRATTATLGGVPRRPALPAGVGAAGGAVVGDGLVEERY